MKKTDLEKLARHLRAALNVIESELEPITVDPAVQSEVDRKIAARICLAWDHVIPDGERVIRGLCHTDYATTMSRIRRGEESERDLIQRGELAAEVKKGGRKSARDIAAERKAKELKVAELADKYNKRKKKEQ